METPILELGRVWYREPCQRPVPVTGDALLKVAHPPEELLTASPIGAASKDALRDNTAPVVNTAVQNEENTACAHDCLRDDFISILER